MKSRRRKTHPYSRYCSVDTQETVFRARPGTCVDKSVGEPDKSVTLFSLSEMLPKNPMNKTDLLTSTPINLKSKVLSETGSFTNHTDNICVYILHTQEHNHYMKTQMRKGNLLIFASCLFLGKEGRMWKGDFSSKFPRVCVFPKYT